MELDFPLEFLVHGIPVSFQRKNSKAIREWKERVANAARNARPEPFFCTYAPVSVTILYFSDEDAVVDLDNIIKPILDAMLPIVYNDDRQVVRLVVQRFGPGMVSRFPQMTDTIGKALESERPLIYVRVSDDLGESRW